MSNKDLSIQNNQVSNYYSFEILEKMSKKIASSGMLGTRNENDVFTLFMIAQAEGKNPVQASMEYSIIQGRPALKSQATLVRFQKAGGKINYLKRDDTECEIEFSHPQAGTLIIKWDMERAKQAGLNLNKENWKKYPRQMLAARCIAEGVRALYPACLDGLYLEEEVQDFDNKSFNNKNNAIEVQTENNIDNSQYDEKKDVYVMNDNKYNVVQVGKNKGKKWSELSIDDLVKAREYYTNKKPNEKLLNIVTEVVNKKLSVCPTGLCKGEEWRNLSTDKLKTYRKDYADGKLIGYAEEYIAYIDIILLERDRTNITENEQKETAKESKSAQTVIDVEANEDEDPFSTASDENWDNLIAEQEEMENNPPHQINDDLDDYDGPLF